MGFLPFFYLRHSLILRDTLYQRRNAVAPVRYNPGSAIAPGRLSGLLRYCPFAPLRYNPGPTIADCPHFALQSQPLLVCLSCWIVLAFAFKCVSGYNIPYLAATVGLDQLLSPCEKVLQCARTLKRRATVTQRRPAWPVFQPAQAGWVNE